MSGANFTSNIGAVVLAAGASSRMQEIKQLLPWKKTNLLNHVIGQLKSSDASHIYVVIGANQDEIFSEIDTTNITVLVNEDWSLGMGTSISVAASHIEKISAQYDGLLLTTSDQPLIELNTYNKLINSSINHDRIVACSYAKGFGIPAVFGKAYFTELKSLGEDIGAKSVIKNHLNHLVLIEDPQAEFDLDTKEVYDKYHNIYGR
ncbi:nucleotidyltransferase family protein [Lutimonas halocynthiae]|uniref:nucleotidyltransferase family protein n=1 Tax=Lutimonas halocynthiae TaxID=1446477 RepID=UPI0025B3E90F|nr:nucleotidyltransferase family protein [Lutimonas halocynthiae]MDN3643985.1 nucleotidyltransferase family protein [Lutimonas halocynthiae]